MMYEIEQLELLEEFANQSDLLFSLGIIRSDSFTGEIGEFVACSHYSLKKQARSTEAVDAIDNNGLRYQIKAKKSERINFAIQNLDLAQIDFLVIVYFDRIYTPNKIIRISSEELVNYKASISKKFLATVKHELVQKDAISISQADLAQINKFGRLNHQLETKGITRSSRIVGDIGEFYACHYLGLNKADSLIQKDYDAIDSDGTTYEIKTRRVYESGRRKGDTRRISNLEYKSADQLCVVVLDRNFRCAGIWTMPMENIKNKKSATLRIINNTEGVINHLPSKISWLKT